MHIGLKERQTNSNYEDTPERGDDDMAVVDDPDTVLPGDNVVSDLLQGDIDLHLLQPLESCIPSDINSNSNYCEICATSLSSKGRLWKCEMKEQAQRIEANLCFGNTDDTEEMPMNNNLGNNRGNTDSSIDFEISSQCDDSLDIDGLLQDAKTQYCFNPKQAATFDMIISNTVKRLRGEPCEQMIACLHRRSWRNREEPDHKSKGAFI